MREFQRMEWYWAKKLKYELGANFLGFKMYNGVHQEYIHYRDTAFVMYEVSVKLSISFDNTMFWV